MTTSLNEKILEEKLELLEKARAWGARSVAKLEALVRSGSDEALYRVNPVAFAAEKGVPEEEAVDLFVHAAKAGLFEMNWHLLCPACGQVVESFRALKQLHVDYFCVLCNASLEASLDDFIEVAFTVNPQVTAISYHRPETLSIEDFYFRRVFNTKASMSGVPFPDVMRSLMKLMTYLDPGQSRTADWTAEPGVIVGFDALGNASFAVPVQGEASPAAQTLSAAFDGGKYSLSAATIRPGPVTVEVSNRSDGRCAPLVNFMSAEMLKTKPPLVIEPFLTAKRLLNTQSFRRLFGGEVLDPSQSLKVRNLTFLFTDLKGSTALYDRIGDLKAFSLVQQHFESVEKIVQERSGAVVKTIGDAVMATFLSAVDAAQAAVRMLEEIDAFNRARGAEDIVLKIGIHTGPAIAVTLNERLDYFGQTVNIASRVQSLADSEEVYVTADVYEAAGVKPFLDRFSPEGRSAMLKGIQEKMAVYRVRPHAPTTGANN
jgi:class 3 adenylate cyclase